MSGNCTLHDFGNLAEGDAAVNKGFYGYFIGGVQYGTRIAVIFSCGISEPKGWETLRIRGLEMQGERLRYIQSL